jgi:hypothetical protein
MSNAADIQQTLIATLRRMLNSVHRGHGESVRTHAAIITSELDHLLDPKGTLNPLGRAARGDVCIAVQLGLGIPKIRNTRMLVSEARALFTKGQRHAAERALQAALHEWDHPNEETVSLQVLI